MGGGRGGGRICFLFCHVICDWFRGLVPIKPVQTLLHPVTSKIPSSIPHHRNQRSTGMRCWVSTLRVHYHLQTMQQVSTLQCCSGVQVLTHPMHDATYLYEAPKQSQTAWHTPRIAFRHLPQTLPDLVTLLKGHSFSLHSLSLIHI